MQSWLASKLLAYTMGRLNAGDPKPTLWLDAADVELTFPGDNSWSGVYQGKAAVAEWLGRFVNARIQIFADEVIVKGWPWATTICIRGHAHLDSEGERVYDNRYVIWGELRWGRLRRYEVYEDTQKAKAFDEWQARRWASAS
jgi:ketosteroid isomerase-like protein